MERPSSRRSASGADGVEWRAYREVIAKYLRRAPPDEAEARSYNVVQRTAYLAVIFVLFPMVIWTGLAMSPAFTSVAPFTVTVLGGRQTARTLHFFSDGADAVCCGPCDDGCDGGVLEPGAGDDYWSLACEGGKLLAPTRRYAEGRLGTCMKPISRRKLLTGGLAATAGVAGLAVADRLARRYGLIPPDCGGFYGPGRRSLMPRSEF